MPGLIYLDGNDTLVPVLGRFESLTSLALADISSLERRYDLLNYDVIVRALMAESGSSGLWKSEGRQVRR